MKKSVLEELKDFFTEFFGAAGPLLLKREMRRAKIGSFLQADDDVKANFVENIISLMYPALVSLQKAKMLKVRLYTILGVSKKKQREVVEKDITSVALEKKGKGTVTQELAEFFIAYFGSPGPLLLRQAMQEKKIKSLDELEDEEKLAFIDDILEYLFSELFSQAKIKVLRSEMIYILQVSDRAKAEFYRRGQAGFESTAGEKIIPT